MFHITYVTGCVIKETATCYFFGYYILADISMLAVILKPVSADTNNVVIILCIPSV